MKHWKNSTLIILFFIHLGLVGCSHLKPYQTQSVEIAQGVTLELMSPAILGISKVITQSVTIKHAGEEHNTLAQIELMKKFLIIKGLIMVNKLSRHWANNWKNNMVKAFLLRILGE